MQGRPKTINDAVGRVQHRLPDPVPTGLFNLILKKSDQIPWRQRQAEATLNRGASLKRDFLADQSNQIVQPQLALCFGQGGQSFQRQDLRCDPGLRAAHRWKVSTAGMDADWALVSIFKQANDGIDATEPSTDDADGSGGGDRPGKV